MSGQGAVRLGVLLLFAGVIAMASGCSSKEETASPPGSSSTAIPAPGETQPVEVGEEGATPEIAEVVADDSIVAPARRTEFPQAMAADLEPLAVYVRLSDPSRTVDKIDQWIAVLNTSAPDSGQTLRGQLAQMGLDVAHLPPGETLALYVWVPDPNQTVAPPAWALVVPAAADATIGVNIANIFDGVPPTPIGNDVLIASSAEARDAALAIGERLQELRRAPMPSDLQVYVDVDYLMRSYGPMVRTQLAMLPQLMAMAAEDSTQAEQIAQAQALLRGWSTLVMDGMDQLRDVTLNVDLAGDQLRIDKVVRAKEGSAIAQFLSHQEPVAPDLSSYMIPGATVIGVMAYRDLQSWAEAMKRGFAAAMPPGNEASLSPFNELMDRWGRIDSLDYAFAMNISLDSPMLMEAIMRSEDPDTLIDLTRQSYGADMNALWSGMMAGGDLRMEPGPEREVQGQNVWQHLMHINVPDMPEEQAELLQTMYGGGTLPVEIMRLDQDVLVALGLPIDALAERVATGTQGEPTTAERVFEPGGLIYVDINLVQYVETVLAAELGRDLTGHYSAPPLVLSGHAGNDAAWFQMGLARNTIAGIVRMIEIERNGAVHD